MKSSRVSPRSGLTIVAVCAGALALTFTTIGYAVTRFVKLTPPAFAPTPKPMPSVATADLYTLTDKVRLTAINRALLYRKPILDADLSWAIDLLQRGPVIDTPFTRTEFAARTIFQLSNHGSMTPTQNRKLAQALLPYADDPPPNERADLIVNGTQEPSPTVTLQKTTLIMLSLLDDKAAHDKLAMIARSSVMPGIRNEAKEVLKSQEARNARQKIARAKRN